MNTSAYQTLEMRLLSADMLSDLSTAIARIDRLRQTVRDDLALARQDVEQAEMEMGADSPEVQVAEATVAALASVDWATERAVVLLHACAAVHAHPGIDLKNLKNLL